MTGDLLQRGLACAAVTLIVVAYEIALGRLRVAEATPRGASPWFGYTRDGVNLAACALLLLAYALGGFSGPLCLLLGLTLALFVYLLDWALGKALGWRAARWAVASVSASLAIASMLAAPWVSEWAERLLRTAAPR